MDSKTLAPRTGMVSEPQPASRPNPSLKLKARQTRSPAQLAVVNQASRRIHAAHEAQAMAQAVAEVLDSYFGFGHSSILWLDESAEELVLAAIQGAAGSILAGYRQKITAGIMGRAVQTRQAQLINDTRLDPDCIASAGMRALEQKRLRQQKRQAEDALRQQNELLENMFSSIHVLVAYMDNTFKFIRVNRAYAEADGRPPEFYVGKNHFDLFPNEANQAIFRNVVETGEPYFAFAKPFEYAGHPERGVTYWDWSLLPVKDADGKMQGLILTVINVTERERAEEALEKTAQELARSNRELEQFAYVTSHDLQEPLRMVSSYTQLLARRYQGQLDPDADEFIAYAVDGANRMQRLINDLLSYSRVNRRDQPFEPVEANIPLSRALINLHTAIQESGAQVTHDPLPTVVADEAQLVLLFQNLIGDAIKFRGEDPPRVQVSAERKRDVTTGADEWLFSVRDNGIGIDPLYHGRIFLMFQRLHSRSQYEGTGIGLAICKRIVERHGGRIWVESAGTGKGATFFFTLPIAPG